jgi:hypothetical protein
MLLHTATIAPAQLLIFSFLCYVQHLRLLAWNLALCAALLFQRGSSFAALQVAVAVLLKCGPAAFTLAA